VPRRARRSASCSHFAPEAREADLRALLQPEGASIVSGPTALGVYTLRIAPEQRTRLLERLRGSAVVQLAEPVAEEAAR
jgi:hypothetical protein